MTPTQRSLKLLREEYHMTVAVVEHWNPFAKIRQDLFGFADLIAYNKTHIYLIQTTTKANMPSRRKKIQDSPLAMGWLTAGGVIVLHGWYKKGRKWECETEFAVRRAVERKET